MASRFKFMAVAACCCAVLTGCDWGGVDDEDNWNEGYAWLNFTGNYRLKDAIQPAADSGEDDSGQSSQQPTVTKVPRTGAQSFTTGANTAIFTGSLSTIGVGIVPGTVSVRVSPKNGGQYLFSDNGSESLNGQSGNGSGTVKYATGAFSLDFGSAIPSGSSVKVDYQYYVEKIEGVNPGSNTSTSSSGGSVTPIVYLTVVQKGNKLSMTDSNGVSYSGSLTGVSVGRDSYGVAGEKSAAFDVKGSDGSRIVGSFIAFTSSADRAGSVTLSNRRVTGTYSKKKASSSFIGVCAGSFSTTVE